MARRSCLLLALALSATAAAEQFRGRAEHHLTGAGVAGAEVYVEWSGSSGETPVTRTDAQGNFAFAAEAPLVVRIAHPDYQGFRDVVRTAAASPLTCTLVAAGAVTLAPDEAEELERYRSASGNTVFMFPYRLRQEIPRFNEDLAWYLDLKINTTLQAVGGDMVSVAMLPESLNRRGDRRTVYGRKLNALALVSGMSGNRNGSITLTSRFQIVPGDMGMIVVRDEFAPSAIEEAALDEALSELWGQSTVLSIAHREFEEATGGAAVDSDRLARTRDNLLAFRADLPAGSESLVQQVDRLLDAIAGRLAP